MVSHSSLYTSDWSRMPDGTGSSLQLSQSAHGTGLNAVTEGIHHTDLETECGEVNKCLQSC